MSEIAYTQEAALGLAKDGAVMVLHALYLAQGQACRPRAHGPDPPYADHSLASGEVHQRTDTQATAVAELPPPLGASRLLVGAQRHTPHVMPVEPLVGLESMIVSPHSGVP